MTIGLLGGSFNPAHSGHREVSLSALRRLKLDQVWWLVSPQNPLKPTAGMAPLDARLRQARIVAQDRRIWVSDIERPLGTRYTADTLRRLVQLCPGVRFVWLMGADNLAGIHRWRAWRHIFETLPIAVLARPAYAHAALAGRAARVFRAARVPEAQARSLARRCPPAWTFLHTRLDPTSATDLRRRGQGVPHQE
ncbi:MAG: nicotinate-nucleotide adenylyltransferase [Alphaproteobacteria bacterium]|nr:MAG: nicotinate-nucleotide adenylyltransferase [Alphaproteobacteria bacterium]